MEPNPEEQSFEEAFLTKEPKLFEVYSLIKKEKGVDNDLAIDIGLQLASCYIGNYKLNHCDELLNELEAGYEKRGGLQQIKGREARAFCRWKQGRYEEALEIFEWQLKVVGPNVALYENMGHTYNKIGKFDDAERCLKGAIELLESGVPEKPGQKGGIFLGLANVQQAKGKLPDALQSRLKALETYNQAHGHAPHSLCAKANLYVGQTYMQMLSEFLKAEPYFREALRLFKITCENSPLTLGSLNELGDFLICKGTPESVKEAHVYFKESLEMQPKLETIHLSEVTHALKMVMDFPPVARDPRKEVTPESIKTQYQYYLDYLPLISTIIKCTETQKSKPSVKLMEMFSAMSNGFLLLGDRGGCQEMIRRTVAVAAQLDQSDKRVIEAMEHCKGLIQFWNRNQ